MIDSYDDNDFPEGRPILYRIIEGLSVIAFVAAVVIWQSDGTLEAVRKLVSGAGEPEIAAAVSSPHFLAARASDVRLAPSARAAAPSAGGSDLDMTETGSIERGKGGHAQAGQGGWVSACDGGSPNFCTASQSLARPDDPTMETSWTIEKGAGGLVGIWTTPTGVLVSRGMMLSLGDGKPKTVPFESCGPRSCEVRAKLAADFIGLLKGSANISTEIVLRGGKKVTFDFSRNGLDAALSRLGS